MAGYTAIRDVGVSIVALLDREFGDLLQGGTVTLASPGEIDEGGSERLTVYLYRVSENGHTKNAERREIGTEKIKGLPLSLDLHYLVTAHPWTKPNSDTTSGTVVEDQHLVLGRAMQVMQDNSVLRGSDLEGDLIGDRELRISMYPEAPDEVMNVWNTFQDRPFRPSVSYLVGPVTIESTIEQPVHRVTEREVEMYSLPRREQDDA